MVSWALSHPALSPRDRPAPLGQQDPLGPLVPRDQRDRKVRQGHRARWDRQAPRDPRVKLGQQDQQVRRASRDQSVKPGRQDNKGQSVQQGPRVTWVR